MIRNSARMDFHVLVLESGSSCIDPDLQGDDGRLFASHHGVSEMDANPYGCGLFPGGIGKVP